MTTTSDLLPPALRPAPWVTPTAPARAAASLLRDHLLLDPACRRRWQSRAARHHYGRINQAGVAQVLAEWMWDSGEAPESDLQLPRRLKDRVSRALSGECLPPPTLHAFIEAFQIPDPVADRLWDAHLTDTRTDTP